MDNFDRFCERQRERIYRQLYPTPEKSLVDDGIDCASKEDEDMPGHPYVRHETVGAGEDEE